MPSSDVMEAAVHAHVCSLNNADRNAMVERAAAFAFSEPVFVSAKIGHA